MNLHILILKIKKRLIYFFYNIKSVETYFLKIKKIDFKHTIFKYGNHDFIARMKPSSDYDVINQVVVLEEYKIPLSFLNNNTFVNKSIIMIDAGANIGATTLYFKNNISKSCLIFCIEPDKENFELLNKNTSNYINDNSVILFNAGLTGELNQNLLINSKFGDGREWAKSIEITEKESSIKSITIDKIINDYNIGVIDFLKIDIEGSERFLIEPNTNLEFLKITRCIAIEIHDELGIREQIDQILYNYNFVIIIDGQTTIGFNQNL